MQNLKRTKTTRFLSVLLLLLLTAAIAFSFAGCEDKNDGEENMTTATTADTTVATTANTTTADASVRGEGDTEFIFKVVTADGETKTFTVKTNKTIVGEALVDAGLIEGEDGQYGLYVKVVDGETLDYDTHGKYWAFYVDGEYALKGVDQTEIEQGKEYCFKADKG